MATLSTLDDDHCGPQPLIQPLEATPCRRARLADAGRLRVSPELIAHHKRKAERLRQAAFRQAWRKLIATAAQLIRRPH